MDQIDKMMTLTLANSKLKDQLKKSNDELSTVRQHLLKILSIKKDDVKLYKNVKLNKLIDLLFNSKETPSNTLLVRSGKKSNSIPVENSDNLITLSSLKASKEKASLPSIRSMNKKLDNSAPESLRDPKEDVTTNGQKSTTKKDIEKILEETQQRFLSVQRRCWTLERNNKSQKTTISHWKEKTEEISLHCERLMFHLKQETAAKATAQYTSESLERKVKNSKKIITSIGKERDAIHAKMTLLKQGAEILEGQLRSLDARFVQLRGTLDWSIHHSRGELKECAREFVRLSSEIESYKDKWNSAEDKARQLTYDVTKYKAQIKARPKVAVVEKSAEISNDDDDDETLDDLFSSEHSSGGSSSGDSDDEEGKKKGGISSSSNGKKNKKNKKREEPSWRYETVDTSPLFENH
jgi:hypothetical protein